MPTVHRFGKYRVVIFTNDHRPPHVHVLDKERDAVFYLECPDGPVALRETRGNFSQAELTNISDELNSLLDYLCEKWREIHG